MGFSQQKRLFGWDAKCQQVTNVANTVCGFKRLLGRKYRDPQVVVEQRYLPYKMVEMKDGSIGIKVRISELDLLYLQ